MLEPKLNYNYPDLVKKLIDLEALAVPPMQGEKSGCFSSYDRRSVYNEKTGLYEEWGANDDGGGYIRREGEGIVVLELGGPGVIWRVWSAMPSVGHIRIFIDDKEEPVVDKPFRDYFDKFGDEPSNFPELIPTLSRGRNSYVPIPFRKHCKVYLDKDWGSYYHFTYTVFPEEVNLPSFDGTFDKDSAIALAVADRSLRLRGKYPYPNQEGHELQRMPVSVPPQGKAIVFQSSGSGAITMIKARVDLRNGSEIETRRILRQLALSVTWDDDPSPAVWTPLGDFFGTAPGVNEYRSLPLGMTESGFYSYWYMPFSQGARIELENDGEITRDVIFEIGTVPLPLSQSENLLRFHAKWHKGEYLNLDKKRYSEGGDRWPDWPLLLAGGSGRFCGVHLHVNNRWRKPEQEAETWWYGRWDRKTIDWWWGEGDEKFFVDGEKFPSTFGTGSEDYIGYAWAAEPPFPLFDSAFACQSRIEIDANGHTSVNRFHIGDNVPFTHSFEAFIEKYKGDVWDGNRCVYAATVYWYQQKGTNDLYPKVSVEEREKDLDE